MRSPPERRRTDTELLDRTRLEELYDRYNHRVYVSPDPLQFLYEYEDPLDREIVALVASSLAYGRVEGILKSVKAVLAVMGSSPREFVDSSRSRSVDEALRGFKHRFTDGRQVAELLEAAGLAIRRHGSLNACFLCQEGLDEGTLVPALCGFSGELSGDVSCSDFLVPDPKKGSACKRLTLFLRWMVRSDDVDPGGWGGVPPSRLIVPLDTHMHRICTLLGLTRRKAADMKTALEVTEAFREIAPEDPVRYDFCLTRLGIIGDAPIDELLRRERLI